MSGQERATVSGRPLNILLLCNRPARRVNAATIVDHLDAFTRYSKHQVRLLSFVRQLPSALDLEQFDVVVIHYSIAIGWRSQDFINPEEKRRIRDFSGLKVVFIQDEYRHVNAAIEALRFMRIDVLFTCVPDAEIEKVYPAASLPGLAKVSNLTGYVPEGALDVPAPRIADRPLHLGYRSRKPPFWLGELGYEKWSIADRFADHAEGTGLCLDLSYREQDRLYGPAWTRFVTRCKAMLGVESGASVFDFDGSVERQVEAYLQSNPETTFEDVQRRFLSPYEGRIRLNQISPRCFEAAALRTALVLYEGDYSGVLQPHRHFVPLRKDFANFPEVLKALKDDDYLQQMVDRTYEEIACNPTYSYRGFASSFDEVVAREHANRCAARPMGSYTPARYRLQIALSPLYMTQRILSSVLQHAVLSTRLRDPLFGIWDRLPERAKNIFRPLLRLMGR